MTNRQKQNALRTRFADFVEEVNQKVVFTPGPASLCVENLISLGPVFGRGDPDYDALEVRVLDALLRLTGHSRIARLQGSSTLALEIAIRNFVSGRVLVVNTGYYSGRLGDISRRSAEISSVKEVSFEEAGTVAGSYDWVLACCVETSRALKLPMQELRSLAERTGANLLVDATASIGLEDGHELADVVAYSSCKGLCGLTGAAFIAFNVNPRNEVDSFYLDLHTHLEKKVTGPYHVIQSLDMILQNYEAIRYSVSTNKSVFLSRFGQYSPVPPSMQPLLCTYVSKRLVAEGGALMYQPRTAVSGTIVCHLGEAHLGGEAQGSIVQLLSTNGE